MDRGLGAEPGCDSGHSFGAQPLGIAEIGVNRINGLDTGGGGAEQAEAADQLKWRRVLAVRAIGCRADIGCKIFAAPHHAA